MFRFPRSTAFALGLISATGFAPLGLWPVTLVALALWMVIVARADRLRAALMLGWTFGLGHFVIGLNWIAGAFRYQETMPVWLGWIAVVALSLYLAAFPALAAGLAWRCRRNPRAYPLFFAAAWMAAEWLRATLFTGFAWNPLGVIWVGTPAAGLARLIGTYGLSGLTILVSGAIAVPRRIIAAPIALLGILLGGFLTLAASGPTATTDRLIRVVQPNIGQQDKHDESFDERNYRRVAGLSGRPGDRPRLILWPEAAVPYFLEEERWARDRIAALMGPRDLILTGGDALVHDRDGRVVAARNSVFAMDAQARLLARYDKAHLVPYGEYLALPWLWRPLGLSRLVPGDIDFLPGPGPQTYRLPGFGTVALQICYEIVFSGEVIDEAHRPALLFNPSNDAWFGGWGPPQHLAQARLRAIEEGMPVVRATPTGISAVIDPRGRIVAALPAGKAGFIQTPAPTADPPTLFARFGNALPLGLALLLAVGGFALSRPTR